MELHKKMDNPTFTLESQDNDSVDNELSAVTQETQFDKQSCSKDSGVNSETSVPISSFTGDSCLTEQIEARKLDPLPPPTNLPTLPPLVSSAVVPPISSSEPPSDGDDYLPPCGLGQFQPQCLRRVAHPITYLVLVCLLVFVQSFLVSGYLNSITTTIEKRYNLRTVEVGVIVSMYDAACIVTTVFVSYYANQMNRARYLAASTLAMAVGFAIFIIPHFTGDFYTPSTVEQNVLCGANSSAALQCQSRSSQPWALSVFLVAQIVIGVAATPIYIIGPTFLFDMLRPMQYPIYSAFIYVAGALGPACGFALSSVFLSVYIDFPTPPPDPLNPDHSQWLGAWWIGFVVSAVLAPFVALPLFTFKKSFPAWMQAKYSREDAMEEEGKRRVEQGLEEKTVKEVELETATFAPVELKKQKEDNVAFKDLPKAIKRLFVNPVWLFISLLSVEENFVVTAFAAFGSKYLQTAYGLPAYQASIRTGVVLIPSACVGLVLGAIVMRKMRLNIFHASNVLVVICVLSTVLMALLMFLGCDSFQMAGLHVNYNGTATPINTNFLTSCNSACNCSLDVFRPVCAASTGMTYYSPCHAGCTDTRRERTMDMFSSNLILNYTNCRCVDGITSVQDGRCTQDCPTLNYALLVIFLMVLILSTGFEPMHIITLSGVSGEDRSFGLGMQVMMNRLFAFVPAPILFGYIFDSVCILRTKTCFNSEGFCREYDLKKLPYVWIGLLIGLKVVGLGFAVCLTYFSKKSTLVEVDLEETEGATKVNRMKVLNSTLADASATDVKNFAVRQVTAISPKS